MLLQTDTFASVFVDWRNCFPRALNVYSWGLACEQVNISMVVDDDDGPKCVQELHQAFWPDSDEVLAVNGHL